MWIEVHTNIGRNRKVLRFANNLNIAVTAAVGHLVLLWTSIMEQAESGDITEWRPQELANAAQYGGDPAIFFQALKDGFLDERDGRLLIHDWWDYAGLFLHRKYNQRNPDKLALIRQLYNSCIEVAVNPPTLTYPPIPTHQPNASADADGSVAGNSPEQELQPPSSRKPPIKQRETWLTPYAETWKKHMGGDLPFGEAAKVLKSLHADPGPDRLCKAMAWYLLHTEARYISISRFAERWKKIEREMLIKRGGL